MTPSVSPRIRAAAALLTILAAPLALAAEAKAPAVRREPIALGSPKDFSAAVAAVEGGTGAKGEKLGFADVPLEEGRSFLMDARTAERLLAGSHASFLKAGLYLFRYERSYGLAGEKDHIALLKTADRDAVIRRVGTAGPHQEPTTEALVAWLDALSKDEPFDLAEVGSDFVAGTFVRAPGDPAAVARRCAGISPELVGNRATSIDLLAAEIRDNRTLYLIW